VDGKDHLYNTIRCIFQIGNTGYNLSSIARGEYHYFFKSGDFHKTLSDGTFAVTWERYLFSELDRGGFMIEPYY
jgi:hypothetical protein